MHQHIASIVGGRYHPAFVIRIRHALQRGCAHPVLGPIVLVALALLLCLVFLHGVEQGLAAFGELGLLCVALVAALGVALIHRARSVAVACAGLLGERDPPRAAVVGARRAELALVLPARSLPLRN